MTKKYSVYTTPSFKREYNKLKKRYPKIDDDFENFLDDIEFNGILGDPMMGIVKDGNKVFKKRMINSSARKGLPGGFRIIKYLVTEDSSVYLLDIYSKSDKILQIIELEDRSEERRVGK